MNVNSAPSFKIRHHRDGALCRSPYQDGDHITALRQGRPVLAWHVEASPVRYAREIRVQMQQAFAAGSRDTAMNIRLALGITSSDRDPLPQLIVDVVRLSGEEILPDGRELPENGRVELHYLGRRLVVWSGRDGLWNPLMGINEATRAIKDCYDIGADLRASTIRKALRIL